MTAHTIDTSLLSPSKDPSQPTSSAQSREMARLENLAAGARAEKANLRDKIRELLANATKTQSDIDKVLVAIANAEHKMHMIGRPRFHQVSARDRAIAAGLMGQDVKVADLPAESFERELTAEDINSGLRALRADLEQLHSNMRTLKNSAAGLKLEYAKQHAIEHAALFLITRDQIVDHFMSLCSAQQLARELGPFAFLTPPHFEENFSIPGPDSADALVVMRHNKIIGRGDIDGRTLVSGPSLSVYRQKLKNEMESN